ncbi:helix-turn-helix transcriptional regulator [Slackia piriformis]|uniref:helix-turn-helix transcriptional regulator n=2 Tax=Eggerthellaceae TaxID=1643826 RepID=UPI00260741F8|nr:helix-turn-helix transcriptional regulator [Slackia piriformis]
MGFVFASGLLGDAADFGIGRFLYALSAIVLVIVSSFVLTQVDLVRIVEAREGVQDKQGVEDACRSMAERFGLSVRETEVMVYLANGRTVPYIQDKLTISQSTVKTHVRNIYRKMGVKGKQELLDVIEKEIF